MSKLDDWKYNKYMRLWHNSMHQQQFYHCLLLLPGIDPLVGTKNRVKFGSHQLAGGAVSRSVLIRISDDRKKATVIYKRKKQVELPVYESYLPHYELMVQKPRVLDETYMKDFIATCSKRVQQLIFSIVLDDSI